MTGATIVAGLRIPSADPFFLTIVGMHISFGLACVIAGAAAMLSKKGRGRHPTFGKAYFWCLSALVASSSILAYMRWSQDYQLFLIGLAAFAAAWLGRQAIRSRRLDAVRLHLTGMGTSYVLMLVAFYVDNGEQLPLWRALPHFMYWLLPPLVGAPLIVRAYYYHPLVRAGTGAEQVVRQ